ncbi:phage virion morphogenesis protein [Salmonella enterica]|nr:phage virion morphogenesis protein [Salmonella enterica]ECC2872166.1 phage virion morphogenesis protein [Salmonella enterica subsp. enterica serovar Tanger]EAR3987767.1 phage virion morphogenesis protein [Salmonella enterica]EAT6760360.1 phage virion morphogenesis protein [Salmonella enterica]EAY4115008.1 phage virion morphogenesis protein [Salmonella enterica]
MSVGGVDVAVIIDQKAIQRALRRLARLTHGQEGKAISRQIAGSLVSASEQAFETQRDPQTGETWADWSDPYLHWREKHGYVPGTILTLNGDMARSITSDYGPTWALAGSAKIYAAIHQWGGRPGMAPGPAAMPARSFLGLDSTGEVEILDYIKKRAEKALGDGNA